MTRLGKDERTIASMRVAIDLLACQTDSRHRGIGRYAYNLVESMLGVSAESRSMEAVLVIDGSDPPDRLRELRNRLRRGELGARTAVYSYPRIPDQTRDQEPAHADTAARLRGRFFESMAPNVLLQLSHFETNSNYITDIAWSGVPAIPSAVIAYDLIPLIYSDRYLPVGQPITDWYKRKCETFKKYRRYLAISEAAGRSLTEYLDIEPERISVIGAGLDKGLLRLAHESGADDGQILAGLGVKAPYVLVGSNLDWRKNTLGALEVFSRLPNAIGKHHQFVLTQVGDEVHAALQGQYKAIAKRVRVLGNVSDAALAALYRRCEVFFFPSYYEGFGLPLLEAMAFGAAVLSSKGGAMPEVVHNPECLFDPCDPDEAQAKLTGLLEAPSARAALRAGAREYALKQTWERCARRALSALEGVVEKSGRAAASLPQLPKGQLRVETSDISVWTDYLVASGPQGLFDFEKSVRAIAARGIRRIVVDVTTVATDDARTGIQRVVRNFAKGLHEVAQSGEFEVRFVRWTEEGVWYANGYARTQLGLPVVGTDTPFDAHMNDLLFMLDSSWNNPDRFAPLHAAIWEKGGEVVWMIYDLIPIRFPHTCDPGMPPVFSFWLDYAAATADGFMCISSATRDDLERYLDECANFTRRPWTRFVHLGADLDSDVEETPTDKLKDVLAELRDIPAFLMIGTVEPRKDHAAALAALEEVWASGGNCALIIVGKRGWNVDVLAAKIRGHRELNRRLFWFEDLPDRDLSYLLRHVNALIQASLAEGFGLPIIEAGVHGVPLLLSDIPVFREIAGDEAVYFEASNSPHLTAIIRQGLEQGFKQPRPGKIKARTWREVSVDLSERLLNLAD